MRISILALLSYILMTKVSSAANTQCYSTESIDSPCAPIRAICFGRTTEDLTIYYSGKTYPLPVYGRLPAFGEKGWYVYNSEDGRIKASLNSDTTQLFIWMWLNTGSTTCNFRLNPIQLFRK